MGSREMQDFATPWAATVSSAATPPRQASRTLIFGRTLLRIIQTRSWCIKNHIYAQANGSIAVTIDFT